MLAEPVNETEVDASGRAKRKFPNMFIGDQVRISVMVDNKIRKGKDFKKHYHPNYSCDIYQVVSVSKANTYKRKSYGVKLVQQWNKKDDTYTEVTNSKPIERFYFHDDLLKVDKHSNLE